MQSLARKAFRGDAEMLGLGEGSALSDPELIGLAEAGDEPVDWPPQLIRLNPPIASMKAAATSLFTPPW
jgi:hypothetical protein